MSDKISVDKRDFLTEKVKNGESLDGRDSKKLLIKRLKNYKAERNDLGSAIRFTIVRRGFLFFSSILSSNKDVH